MTRRTFTIRARLTFWYTGILFAILVVFSALSYSILRWNLMQDLDASLTTTARIIRDAGAATQGPLEEKILKKMLGAEVHDKFFRLVGPAGIPYLHSEEAPAVDLPLSPKARDNASRGHRTFETIQATGRGRVRLLTMPLMRGGQLEDFVQVAMPFDRVTATLSRYLETLLALVPLGVGLAAVGGVAIARSALKPVEDISLTARRITAEDLDQRLALRGTDDELDHLADTLNGMLMRLQETFGQMRRFAADAAHELRTPLTALRGEVEVALRADRTPEQYRRALRSNLEEVERLIRLAEDLLLLSKSSAGPGAPQTRIDLESLLLDVFDVASHLARGTRVALGIKESVSATVRGDEGALRRAVLNLVENAVKYTPAGGKVELSLTVGDGDASLAVWDTGPGIDPTDAERIFRPFVRLDPSRGRETGGSGLGLAIARSIVLAHGGTLSVESAPGAGSGFTIRLPLA